MAYLFAWCPNDESWGHASLLLEKSQKYISWWPKDNKSKNKKKNTKVDTKDELPDMYEEDIDYNGREASHKFYINERKINAKAVEEWWRLTKGEGGYHFFSRNCCDVVYDALKVGGCYDWVKPGIRIVSTPRHMIRYGLALENAKEKEGGCVIL